MMRRLSGMQKGVEQRMAVVMGDYNGNACMGFGAIAADSVASGRRGGAGAAKGKVRWGGEGAVRLPDPGLPFGPTLPFFFFFFPGEVTPSALPVAAA